jgi:3-hydroxyisobutyrate dehydrogenase
MPTNSSRDTVAVLGIGAIGAAIARNLLAADFPVRVWNRSPEKAQALADESATVCASSADAVAEADVVLTTLYDGPAVHEVMQQAADGLRPGTVWADLSTVGVDDVPQLADLAKEHGVEFVDAPVQGARPVAEQGQLLIYAAGSERAKPVLEPIFAAVGRRTDWLSTEPGSTAATSTKLVVNGWLFALTSATAEAVALAQGLGVDPEAFRAAIAGGPLDNAWAQTKSAAILEHDFSPLFSVRNAAKDAALIEQAAQAAGVRVDVSDAVRNRFERAIREGHGDKDMVATYLLSYAATGGRRR